MHRQKGAGDTPKMARPRGAARSRRHAPPLDKPGRSGLLALRRFHDGLQTPTLVRLLVRTEKEEISGHRAAGENRRFLLEHPADWQSARATPASPRHPKKKSHLEPEISKCDFFFWPNMASNGPRAHPQHETHGRGRPAPAFIKTQVGSPSISVPHISQH